jgi:hypothetical protein
MSSADDAPRRAKICGLRAANTLGQGPDQKGTDIGPQPAIQAAGKPGKAQLHPEQVPGSSGEQSGGQVGEASGASGELIPATAGASHPDRNGG